MADVKITSDSMHGFGTKVFVDGQEISEVVEVRLRAAADDIVQLEMVVNVENLDVDLPADVRVIDSSPSPTVVGTPADDEYRDPAQMDMLDDYLESEAAKDARIPS